MYETEVREAADAIAHQDDRFFLETVDRDQLATSAQKSLATLAGDIARIKKSSDVLFPPPPLNSAESADHGKKLAQLFESWRADPPSTTALVCVAAEHFGIPSGNINIKAALMVSFAAGVPHANTYHSTDHFREVTADIAMLAHINNALAANGVKGAKKLDENNLAKCLLAAAAHDLLHDGKGNSPSGHWQQYRLENKSIAAAQPFMTLAGMGAADIEDVRVMIRVTDISSNGHTNYSPHKYLRSVSAEVFEGEKPTQKQLEMGVPAGLSALKKDEKLLIMASLLSDADLFPAGGTDYAFSRKLGHLLSQEPIKPPDCAATLVKFIEGELDQRKFTSAAGQRIGKDALDAIYAEAKEKAAHEMKEDFNAEASMKQDLSAEASKLFMHLNDIAASHGAHFSPEESRVIDACGGLKKAIRAGAVREASRSEILPASYAPPAAHILDEYTASLKKKHKAFKAIRENQGRIEMVFHAYEVVLPTPNVRPPGRSS